MEETEKVKKGNFTRKRGQGRGECMFCVASYLTNNLSFRVLEFADVDLHTIPILLRTPQCVWCFFGCVRGAALLHSCVGGVFGEGSMLACLVIDMQCVISCG